MNVEPPCVSEGHTRSVKLKSLTQRNSYSRNYRLCVSALVFLLKTVPLEITLTDWIRIHELNKKSPSNDNNPGFRLFLYLIITLRNFKLSINDGYQSTVSTVIRDHGQSCVTSRPDAPPDSACELCQRTQNFLSLFPS